MGLFSNIFKSIPKKTFASEKLGNFKLVYSKRNKHLWTNDNSEIPLTVKGTEEYPNDEQISFLTNFKEEVFKLSEGITKKFKSEFREADINTSFKNWEERFKIVGASVMLIFENETYWNITFEDLEEPYTHFTLFIEGEKLTDFSIDT